VQNLEKFIEYGSHCPGLLVSSDAAGERNPTTIRAFIDRHPRFLISSTYDSVDVIDFNRMTNPLVIIDEFHNLSRRNVTDKRDPIYRLLASSCRIMFMSATPRVFEVDNDDIDFVEDDDENSVSDGESDEESSTEFNPAMLGQVLYNMPFKTAIDCGYITDYRIWLPSIHEDNSQLVSAIESQTAAQAAVSDHHQLDAEVALTVGDIEATIKAKCMYLYSCLLNNGSRKCIVYCVNVAETEAMMAVMLQLNAFYALELNCVGLTSAVKSIERKRILGEFACQSAAVQLIFSVRILDECIDIPSCDSIYITYPSKSNIRTIQRLCRCIRVDAANPGKVGNIYIWCDEYEKTLDILGGMREYDLIFTEKLCINSTNFYGNSRAELTVLDKKFVENYLIGVREFIQLSWVDKLKVVEEYISNNHKLPSAGSHDKKTRTLRTWVNYQTKTYLTRQPETRIIYETFMNKHSILFATNVEYWYSQLNMLDNYVLKYGRLPSSKDNNPIFRDLYSWVTTQQRNYKSNTQIMENIEIRNAYSTFKNKYTDKKILISYEQQWFDKLQKVEQYIKDTGKLPITRDDDEDIRRIGVWLANQKRFDRPDKSYNIAHKNKKNVVIRAEYFAFKNRYKNLFK
jgi:hypothetical protein